MSSTIDFPGGFNEKDYKRIDRVMGCEWKLTCSGTLAPGSSGPAISVYMLRCSTLDGRPTPYSVIMSFSKSGSFNSGTMRYYNDLYPGRSFTSANSMIDPPIRKKKLSGIDEIDSVY